MIIACSKCYYGPKMFPEGFGNLLHFPYDRPSLLEKQTGKRAAEARPLSGPLSRR